MKTSDITKLDKLWSEAVKLIGGNKCLRCGRITTLNSHHFYSKSNQSTRWDIDNGVCLCVAHHVFGTDSAHKAPADFVDFMIEERGQEWLDALRIRKNTIRKQFYEEVKHELEDIILDYSMTKGL